MVTALVVAAGTGDRLGGNSPKALVELAGRPLLAWCLDAFGGSSGVERLVVAAPPGFENEIAKIAAESAPALRPVTVPGGPSRSQSVSNALEAAQGASIVVVHDAARPLVTAELVESCVERLKRGDCDGVVAAAPVTDTIKQTAADGRVSATLERDRLWAVQTPQVFRTETLRAALGSAARDTAYDDAQLVEAAGGDVRIVEAPRENLKVTTPLDLRMAELLLENRR